MLSPVKDLLHTFLVYVNNIIELQFPDKATKEVLVKVYRHIESAHDIIIEYYKSTPAPPKRKKY
jgi:hypothetical protein